jgi:hypothetical protein
MTNPIHITLGGCWEKLLLIFNRNKAGRYTETEEYQFDKWMRLLTLPLSYRDRSLRHDSVRTQTTNI